MLNMKYIQYILLASLVALILLLASYSPSKFYNSVNMGYSWNNCISKCNDAQEECMQGCYSINGENSCELACLVNASICADECPGSPSLRNGTMSSIYIYRLTDMVKVGTISGWSPHALELLPIDFPLLVSDNYNANENWDRKNAFNYVIQDPGCFVIWDWGGYYKTHVICTENSKVYKPDYYKNRPCSNKFGDPKCSNDMSNFISNLAKRKTYKLSM